MATSPAPLPDGARAYLGTHLPHWLNKRECATVPLFVSHRRLRRYRTLPRAVGRWALDSGGFSELAMYGGWVTTAKEYISAVRRYREEVGGLDWCAPQDWMCEPTMLAKTGLTVTDHQNRTVDSFVRLADHLGDLVVPVVQGWEHDDYLRCVDLYDARGIDLTTYRTVGVGSVCRRNADAAIGRIVRSLDGLGLRAHGFGIRSSAFVDLYGVMASSDSMAWSAAGRRRPDPTHGHRAASCANCLAYALRWRSDLVARARSADPQLPFGPPQRIQGPRFSAPGAEPSADRRLPRSTRPPRAREL